MSNALVQSNIGVKGTYTNISVIRGNGQVDNYPDVDNLIHDDGLKYLVSTNGSFPTYGYPSTDTNEPVATDKIIPGLIKSSTSDLAIYSSGNSVDLKSSDLEDLAVTPKYTYSRSFTFSKGSIIGSITKLGVAYSTIYPIGVRDANNESASDSFLSSVLIKDGSGNPTEIILGEEDQLTFTYELSYELPDLEINLNAVDIDGVPTDIFITRYGTRSPVMISSSYILRDNLWTSMQAYAGTFDPQKDRSILRTHFSPNFNTVTPTNDYYFGFHTRYNLNGAAERTTSRVATEDPYTYKHALTILVGAANHPEGIGGITIPHTAGVLLMAFDPPIQKTDVHELTIEFNSSYFKI